MRPIPGNRGFAAVVGNATAPPVQQLQLLLPVDLDQSNTNATLLRFPPEEQAFFASGFPGLSLTSPHTLEGFRALMRVQLAHRRLDLGLQSLQSMKDQGLSPDDRVYSSLLRMCRSLADLPTAEKLWSQAEQEHVSPYPFVVTSLLAFYARIGEPERAEATINKISRSLGSSAVDVVMHTCLVQAHLNRGNLEEAWNTFRGILAEGVTPDTVLMTTMIQAAAWEHRPERAFQVAQQMQELEIPFSEVTYTALIQACATNSEFYELAQRFFSNMQADGIRPNNITLSTMMSAAATAGAVEDVFSLFEVADSPDWKLHQSFFLALSRLPLSSGGPVTPMQFWSRFDAATVGFFQDHDRKPKWLLDALMTLYTNQLGVQRAETLLGEWLQLSRDGPPDLGVFTHLIKMHSRRRDFSSLQRTLQGVVDLPQEARHIHTKDQLVEWAYLFHNVRLASLASGNLGAALMCMYWLALFASWPGAQEMHSPISESRRFFRTTLGRVLSTPTAFSRHNQVDLSSTVSGVIRSLKCSAEQAKAMSLMEEFLPSLEALANPSSVDAGTRAEFGRQIEDHFRQWETLMFSANQLSPQVKRLAHSPTSKKWSSKKEVPPQNALLVASPKRGLPASWGRKEMGKLSLKRRHRLPDTPKRVTVTPRLTPAVGCDSPSATPRQERKSPLPTRSGRQ